MKAHIAAIAGAATLQREDLVALTAFALYLLYNLITFKLVMGAPSEVTLSEQEDRFHEGLLQRLAGPERAKQFSQLVTRRSRSLYIEHVVQLWPSGRRPTFADDDASVRLADLDREWLLETAKVANRLQQVASP